MGAMFISSALSTPNYDSLLVGWDQRELNDNVPFDAYGVKYSAGQPTLAHERVVADHHWTIAGAGQQLPPPTIASLSPGTGLTDGGTRVTISGTGFLPNSYVTIGGSQCSVVETSATSMVCTTSPHMPGPVDAVVSNPDGQSVTSANGFVFFYPRVPNVPGTPLATIKDAEIVADWTQPNDYGKPVLWYYLEYSDDAMSWKPRLVSPAENHVVLWGLRQSLRDVCARSVVFRVTAVNVVGWSGVS
ncbi:MAG: IPT/TIG domain-containing protein [Actinomycetes bacterium]